MRTFQKRFLSLALVGSAIAAFTSTPLLGQDITTGLVGHWTFDDQSLDESSGFQDDGVHDGIAVGTIAYTDDTPAGGFALDMTASGGTELEPIESYVQVLNSNIIVGGSPGAGGEIEIVNDTYETTFDPPELGNGFSIAFWGRGTPTRWQAYVSKNGEGNNGYQVRRRASTFQTTFTLRSTDGNDDPDVGVDTFNNDPAGEDEWHHYTATWTAGENGFRNFYIDGELVHTEIDWIEGQVTDDGEPIAPDNAYGSSRNEFLVFGGRDSGGVIGDGGALCMDDIRIYNRPVDAQAAAILATPADDVGGVLLGDVNRDGLVNFLDISPFVAILSTGEVLAEADINEDRVVDFLDIGPFIELLSL